MEGLWRDSHRYSYYPSTVTLDKLDVVLLWLNSNGFCESWLPCLLSNALRKHTQAKIRNMIRYCYTISIQYVCAWNNNGCTFLTKVADYLNNFEVGQTDKIMHDFKIIDSSKNYQLPGSSYMLSLWLKTFHCCRSSYLSELITQTSQFCSDTTF